MMNGWVEQARNKNKVKKPLIWCKNKNQVRRKKKFNNLNRTARNTAKTE